MSIKSKLNQSRNNWKDKAVSRANRINYLDKENIRIKSERDKYKKELKEARKELEKESSKKILTINLRLSRKIFD